MVKVLKTEKLLAFWKICQNPWSWPYLALASFFTAKLGNSIWSSEALTMSGLWGDLVKSIGAAPHNPLFQIGFVFFAIACFWKALKDAEVRDESIKTLLLSAETRHADNVTQLNATCSNLINKQQKYLKSIVDSQQVMLQCHASKTALHGLDEQVDQCLQSVRFLPLSREVHQNWDELGVTVERISSQIKHVGRNGGLILDWDWTQRSPKPTIEVKDISAGTISQRKAYFFDGQMNANYFAIHKFNIQDMQERIKAMYAILDAKIAAAIRLIERRWDDGQ